MTNSRVPIDLSEFTVEPKKAVKGDAAQAEQLAKESGFNTRHAGEAAPVAQASPQSSTGRKKTTGRTEPFSVKLKPETVHAIKDLSWQMTEETGLNVGHAKVIEDAIAALLRQRGQG
jgi:hypothetical protein